MRSASLCIGVSVLWMAMRVWAVDTEKKPLENPPAAQADPAAAVAPASALTPTSNDELPSAAPTTASTPSVGSDQPAASTAPSPASASADGDKAAPVPAKADVADQSVTEAEKAEVAKNIKDPELRKHILENIDVFGKSEMPAIYILNPGTEGEDIQGSLLTRDFTADPYFMQNIDREEFERETYTLDFQTEAVVNPAAVTTQQIDKDKNKDKKNKDAR